MHDVQLISINPWLSAYYNNYCKSSYFTTDNGIVAKAFLELTEDDIENQQLNITFGGKKILKKLLKQLKKEDITDS